MRLNQYIHISFHIILLFMIAWYLYNLAVPITTNVVSSNPAQVRYTTLCNKVCQ